MTEHEDLIDWARESAPGDSPTELAIRVHRLADALEAVAAERDATRRRNAELTRSSNEKNDVIAALEVERDDLESRLDGLLCEITDGRMTGANYSVQTMVQEVEDGFERAAQDEIRSIEAERDRLAAVVEQVRTYAEGVPRSRERDINEGLTERSWLTSQDVLYNLNINPSVALDRVKAEALREAADAFEGGAINVEIFGDPAETRYWQGANEARGSLVASLRDRADRIEKGESNE